MKFAHLGDCHLGSWRQPELQELNFLYFQKAIDSCIEEKVDFILVAGDLFDSAYPPVEILKQTFGEFRRVKEAGIKCYMIAGSHDYSVSGKTFLDVLEYAGFCEICKYEEIGEEENKIISLLPIKHKGFEIYGYPGKKSGLEVEDLRKIQVPESNNFRILMLHTSVTEAIGTLPIDSISLNDLPNVEYYALAHLHINFHETITEKETPAIYSGPIFPNTFQELEDLGIGSFYIIDVSGFVDVKKKELNFKEIVPIKLEIENSLIATQQIINECEKYNLKDKIVLLRLKGIINQGTSADIDYEKIKKYLEEKQVYSFLKNTHKLTTKQEEATSDIKIDSSEMDKIEDDLIKQYEKENPDKFNNLIIQLIHSLNLQKQEDEKSVVYESRLLSEANKVLNLNLK